MTLAISSSRHKLDYCLQMYAGNARVDNGGMAHHLGVRAILGRIGVRFRVRAPLNLCGLSTGLI